MRDELPVDDAKTIWRNQPTAPSAMTVEKVRQKARELRAKTRRELVGNIALALIAFAFASHGIVRTQDPVLRGAFAIAVAWALVGQCAFYRGMRSSTLASDAAPITGLELYRRELNRSHYLLHRSLRWAFGPAVLSIGSWILVITGLAKRLHVSVNIVPFCVLLLVWIVAVLLLRSRARSQVKREIEELTEIESGSRG